MRHTELGDPSLGWAELSPNWAYAMQSGTWALTYHCGSQDLARGARIRVYPPFTFDNAHNSCVRWKLGLVSARTEAVAQLSVGVVDTLAGNSISVNYTCNVIELTIADACLHGGETVRVTIGDQSGGGEPAVAQWLSGPDMPFHVAVDVSGDDSFAPLTRFPLIEVLGNQSERLVCVARSTPKVGEPFALRIKAEDEHTNISSLYQLPLRIHRRHGQPLRPGRIAHVQRLPFRPPSWQRQHV